MPEGVASLAAPAYGLLNRARFSTSTTGNGLTLAVGSAVPGYVSLTGLPDGSLIGYSIEEGTNFETGVGTYHSASGGTLDRTTVETSSAAGARITLAGNATVFLTLTAAMLGGSASMAFQSSSNVSITGGSASLASFGVIGGYSTVVDPRNPNIGKGWSDQTGNINGYIAADGSWVFGLIGVQTANVATLNATTGTVTSLSATTLTIAGQSVKFLEARNPIGYGWSDPSGNVTGVIQMDGTFRFGNAYIQQLTVGVIIGTFSMNTLSIGPSTIAVSDYRNRNIAQWSDGTDQGVAAVTSTGSLAFSPASGVMAKHLQSRIERSHVLTQGPPTHADSANTQASSSTTYHLCATLDTVGFEAIRLVIPSMNTPAGATITACIATSASATDKLNPVDGSGNPVAWKPVSFASNGQATDWEDQTYGSIQLTTNSITLQGANTLNFASTTGVLVGMVCYIPAYATGAAGIPLSDHWATVTAVTSTSVTLSKPIQKMYNAAGGGQSGLPTAWPVFFSPNKLIVPAYPGVSGGSSVTLLVSDWIPLSSLDRSDGGRWPIVMVRIYATGGSYTTLVTDLSQTNWGGMAKDRIWNCYTQGGDFVSTQSGFTSATDNGTMALGWIQYYSRTRGATVMFIGDSITQGINQGNVSGIGALQYAAYEMSTPSVPVTNVGMVNGWNSAGVGEFIWTSALSHMDVFKPQVLGLCTWTRNGEFNVPPAGQPAYAQECADWYFQQSLRLAQKAMRRYRAQTLYFPMGPSDASEMVAATETVRLTGVVRARQAGQSGEMYLDQDALLGTGSTPVNDTYYPGLHPPASAQMILSLDAVRQIKNGLGI